MVASRRLGALLLGGALVLAAGACGSDDESASVVFPDAEWATATPEEVGVDAVAIDELVTYLESTNSNCMAVVKDGRLIAEQYWNGTDEDTQQQTWSATKSVSGTLVGIAQDQGFLDIDQKASDFITEWQGTDSEDIAIRNLLANDSGRYWTNETDYIDLMTAPNRTEFAIGLGQQHPVGEHWQYNNAAIQTLQAVLERSTEQDMTAFAEENLFGPLGMSSYFETDPSGTEATFIGMQSSCRDLARFGHLALNEGNWDGEQVVSQEWMQEATSPSQDLNTSYGLLWWLNKPGGITPNGESNAERPVPDAPDDAYAALGIGEQIALVLPSQNMVVVRLGPSEAGDEPLRTTSLNEIGRLATAAVGDAE